MATVHSSDKTISGRVVYVFIDASNVWAAQKAKGKLFDYVKLLKYLKDTFGTTFIRAFYYTAYPAEGTRMYSLDAKHKFFTFLEKGLKFTVRKKELKRITVVSQLGESIVEKGNMDVEMTIDALHFSPVYDVALFFTGDSDFLALITYLKNIGKRVYIFSSRNSISQELRTGSDGYVDLLRLGQDIWGQDLTHRAKRI